MNSRNSVRLLRQTLSLFQLNWRGVHVYKNKYSDSYELAVELSKSAIFNDKGLIVLNKPQGISFSNPEYPEKKSSKRVQDVRHVEGEDYEVSLKSLFPHLKKILGVENLQLVRSPEKYISGVAIFSTDDNARDRLKTCILRMRERATPSDSYLAVVVGAPNSASATYKGAATLKIQENGKQKKVVFINEWSQNSVRKGLVKQLTVSHEVLTLDEQSNTSLLKLTATRNMWHCLRAYLATCLMTPILGDNIFGSCVKTVLGMPVLVDQFSQAAQLPQKLSHELKSRLELASRSDVKVPLHLHQSEVVVEGFPGKGNVWKVSVPPPHHFLWTCSRLALQPPQPGEVTSEVVASS